jgi:hypothetical protein
MVQESLWACAVGIAQKMAITTARARERRRKNRMWQECPPEWYALKSGGVYQRHC